MFVVFENGGKQYKLKKDDVFKIEKTNCSKGDILKFSNILLFSIEGEETIIGTPYVKEVVLSAKVLDIVKDKKVLIFKKKRRHNYRRKLGHRQNLIILKVTDISYITSKSNSVSDAAKLRPKISNKLQPKE